MKSLIIKARVWMLISILFPLNAIAVTVGKESVRGLENPLKGIGNLDELIIAVLGIVVKIGAYVAVFFIIWSGFLFVKAQGNSTELQKAKDTFLWTIVGIAILLGAQALALALGSTINTIVK